MSPRALALLLSLLAVTPALAVARGAGQYPEATSWSPAGMNAPVEGPILITWSARMNTTSIESAFRLIVGNATWNASAFQWAHSTSPPWTSRATPSIALPPLTNVTALVLPTAQDTGGNRLDQNRNGTGGEPTDELRWTFRTDTGKPPRVLATSPPDGRTGVRVAENLTITFSQPMNTTSVETAIEITPATSGGLGWTANGTLATLDPTLYLRYGTTYTVRLDAKVATDQHARRLDGNGDGVGGDNYTFSFMTEPNLDPPQVLAVTPDRNATDVSVTANFVIRFSEPMNRTAVEVAFTYTDGITTSNRTAGTFSWQGLSFPDDEATFNPYTNLPFNVTITATLNASQAKDSGGLGLDGNGNGTSQGSPADDVTWSFTTEPTDTTPPIVVAVDPPDNATEASETTSIALAFSEAMNRTSVEGAFTLRDDARLWSKADGTFRWSRGNDSATYTPATTLPFDADFRVRLNGTASDVNRNAMSSSFSSSFRTRMEPDVTPPTVGNTDPGDGQDGVSRNPTISITFDDPMNRTRTEVALVLENDTVHTGDALAMDEFQWTAADHTVSFQPLGLLRWDARYRVTVSQAAHNAVGLALELPYAFSFHTAPWKGRVIGRVVEGDQPVTSASVTLGKHATLTAANGSFEFPSVLAGTYNLTMAKDGYLTTRTRLGVDPRNATANETTVDLGTFSLARPDGASPFLIGGVVAAGFGAVLILALTLRRLRGPPLQSIDEPEDPDLRDDLSEDYEI